MLKFSSTTKVSSRRTSHKKRLRSIILLGGGLLVVLLLLPRVFGFVSSLVFMPLAITESATARISALLPAYFTDRHELITQINQLEARIAQESSGASTVVTLQRENQALRALLGDETDQRIAAGVIGRPTVTPYDVLVIDQGSSSGIVEAAPVYVGRDQVIGFVERVYEHSAVVVLATTPGYASTVYIYGPNIYTTARGLGGGVLEVSVPQGIEIAEDDVVVLPSLSSGVYGTLSVIESIASEPEQRGYVTSQVPLHSLRFVSVGRKPLEVISFDSAREVVAEAREALLRIPVPAGVLVDFQEDTGTTTASTTEAATTSPAV